MTTAKAERFLLSRLSSAGTALLSLHLALPDVPAWADGQDAEGYAVVLVGAHTLRSHPDPDKAQAGEAFVARILAALAEDDVPEGVHPVAYAPKASEAIAAIVTGTDSEYLLHGPRASGKSQLLGGVVAVLAELHERQGGALPLQLLSLHASVEDAKKKLAKSLEAEHWGSLWTLRQDRTEAALSVGGRELAVISFVGTLDAQARERARAEAHVVLADEVVPTEDSGDGVPEPAWETAINSGRLPTPLTAHRMRKRLGIACTNPGAPTHWAHRRFLEAGVPGCRALQIPASDRLTPEEIAAQRETFRTAELQQRLGDGEWVGTRLGPQVAVGYNATTHVAPKRLEVVRGTELVCGWDSSPGSHYHACVIGARLGQTVHVYAGLVAEETGLQQLLDAYVLPWFAKRAPWALTERGRDDVRHYYDPAMKPHEGGDAEQNGVARIKRALGSAWASFHAGPSTWDQRASALSSLLTTSNGRGGMMLQICPSDDTALLRRALAFDWFYATTKAGTVVRDLPSKPNHPAEDVGDAFCYLAGGVAPSKPPRLTREPLTVKPRTSVLAHYGFAPRHGR